MSSLIHVDASRIFPRTPGPVAAGAKPPQWPCSRCVLSFLRLERQIADKEI